MWVSLSQLQTCVNHMYVIITTIYYVTHYLRCHIPFTMSHTIYYTTCYFLCHILFPVSYTVFCVTHYLLCHILFTVSQSQWNPLEHFLPPLSSRRHWKSWWRNVQTWGRNWSMMRTAERRVGYILQRQSFYLPLWATLELELILDHI